MTETEIGTLLKTPFPKLAELCKDPVVLVAVLSLAINMGIRIGQTQTHKAYHTMMADYNDIAIKN